MERWSANFTNNPFDDYNLIVEILFCDEMVGLISNIDNELLIRWYASETDLDIPFNWLKDLMLEAEKRLSD